MKKSYINIEIHIRDALRSANLLNNEAAAKLTKAVSETVSLWKAEMNDATYFRTQHDLLKSIWSMLQEPDPPIGQIRARFMSLPHSSRYYLRRRASRLWPRAFMIDLDCDPYRYIERMGKKQLLRRLPVLLVEGGLFKNDLSKEFEPTILGVTRGLNVGPVGGRPRGDDELRLIMYLAFDWLYATGELPKRGRNTQKGFAELVSCVFEWVTNLKADQALRRYWEQVPKQAK